MNIDTEIGDILEPARTALALLKGFVGYGQDIAHYGGRNE